MKIVPIKIKRQAKVRSVAVTLKLSRNWHKQVNVTLGKFPAP
ncbi:MAG: hypothetical protein AAB268_07290 [Elusimicrobiota bacterium]